MENTSLTNLRESKDEAIADRTDENLPGNEGASGETSKDGGLRGEKKKIS